MRVYCSRACKWKVMYSVKSVGLKKLVWEKTGVLQKILLSSSMQNDLAVLAFSVLRLLLSKFTSKIVCFVTKTFFFFVSQYCLQEKFYNGQNRGRFIQMHCFQKCHLAVKGSSLQGPICFKSTEKPCYQRANMSCSVGYLNKVINKKPLKSRKSTV